MFETYEYMRSNPLLNLILIIVVTTLYLVIGEVLVAVIELFMGEKIFGARRSIAASFWPLLIIGGVIMGVVFLGVTVYKAVIKQKES